MSFFINLFKGKNMKKLTKELWHELVMEKAIQNNSFNMNKYIKAKKAADFFIATSTLPTQKVKSIFDNIVG